MSDFNRDRWKRPLIITVDAAGRPLPDAKPVPYKRVSKFAKVHDDSFNLINWYQRTTAIGLVAREDLWARAKSIVDMHTDPLNNDGARSMLRNVTNEAHEAGGGSTAAERGTLWHRYMELMHKGGFIEDVLDQVGWARITEMYRTLQELGIKVLDVEVPVVNDWHKSAGTFDLLLQLPDGRVVVGDLKTGSQDPKYPSGVCAQIRQYATGQRYNVVSGERTPIHPDLTTSLGLLIHVPASGDGTHLYALHLSAADPLLDVSHTLLGVRALKPDHFLHAYSVTV